MSTSRGSWTESNRQLWTSSSEAGWRTSTGSSVVEDLSTNASSMPSTIEPPDRDNIMAAVLRECQESGGARLSSRTESALASLLEVAETDRQTKSLVSVLLATNARRRQEAHEAEKRNAETADLQSKLKSVADEIAVHIRGEAPDEGESVQDSLYRTLLDVEKCVELAQIATKVSMPCLRDTLLEACGASAPKEAPPPHSADHAGLGTSAEISDIVEILESHGYLREGVQGASEGVLQLVKDVERHRRETNFLELALRQYEQVVRRRLATHGDTEPISAELVKANLGDNPSFAALAKEKGPWWEERALRICNHLSRIPRTTTVEQLPQAGPIDISADAAATKLSVADFLDAVDTSILALFHECVQSKEVARDLEATMRAAALLPRSGETSSVGDHSDVPVSETLRSIRDILVATLGLSSSPQPATPGCNETSEATNAECVIPPIKLLGLVVECLPATVRAKFSLEKTGVFDDERAAQLLAAIDFLNEHNRDTIHRIDELCARLRNTFGMGNNIGINEHTLTDQLSFLDDAVSAACRRSTEAVTSESLLMREVRQSIEELAQLLPISSLSPQQQQTTGNTPLARIAAPTDDILEMTRILKSRIFDWQQSQAKHNSAGEHYRLEKNRLEDSVRSFTASAQTLLTEMVVGPSGGESMMKGSGAEAGSEDSELGSGTPDVSSLQPIAVTLGSSDGSLSSILERLKLARSRYVRVVQANATLRSRVDGAANQTKATQRTVKKLTTIVASLCESLGIVVPPLDSGDSVADERAKREAISGSKEKRVSGKLNLRCDHSTSTPSAALPAAAGKVSEDSVVEALQLVAARINSNGALVKKSLAEGEMERLRGVAKRAKSDSAAFREAIAVVLTRLAENGQLMKRALYLLGTDESPKDDVVETVLRKDKDAGEAGADEQDDGNNDEHEANERLLATLLQKYTRWSRRLIETTEDHLDTQQKLVKYFAAVQRYFASLQLNTNDDADSAAIPVASSAQDVAILDENLIDIDTTLMRFADVILPALDRALRFGPGAHCTAGASPPLDGDNGIAASEGDAADTRVGEGLPYDHRLGRLYEMIGRLHTIVTSLLRVRYLSVPTGTRQRSSGDTELLFDAEDSIGNGFVDLDLNKLVRVSAVAEPDTASGPERFSRETKGASSPPPLSSSSTKTSANAFSERVSANNDLIYRVATQNLDCVYQAVRKFSSSHKMAAILIQKDTDAVQERVAAMLEKFSELDVEQAFGEDRQELHDMYAVLKERGTRQKGCYFFSRVNGEGDCVSVRALERLSSAFAATIDKLVDRTTSLSRLRELINDVVDMCAMYVNWTETTQLPAGHALPQDVLANCVRDGEEDSKAVGSSSGRKSCDGIEDKPPGKLPPIPTSGSSRAARTPAEAASSLVPARAEGATDTTDEEQSGGKPRAKVSCFRVDDVVLRVIASMFQLAQEAAEGVGKEAAQQQLHQLEEEAQLLKEANAVAESRAAQLEQDRAAADAEKNKALSEAAVAKAELRRWKRLVETTKIGEVERGGVAGEPPRQITDRARDDKTGPSTPASTPATSFPSVPSEKNHHAATPAPGKHNQGLPTRDSSPPPPDYLQEMVQYMKALSEELHFANHVATSRTEVREEESDEETLDGLMEVAAARAREAQHRLEDQYGSTPLRVVAEPNRRGYAETEGVYYRPCRRTLSRTARSSRDSLFFSNKTPVTFNRRAESSAAPSSSMLAAPQRVSCQRAAAENGSATWSRGGLPKRQQRTPSAIGRPSAHASPHQDVFFDAGPLRPASVSRPERSRQSPRDWTQGNEQPRRRHASPMTASGRDARPGLTDALRTIKAEEENAPRDNVAGTTGRATAGSRQRSASANANVRSAALRRLAEVVSRTKVRDRNGELF